MNEKVFKNVFAGDEITRFEAVFDLPNDGAPNYNNTPRNQLVVQIDSRDEDAHVRLLSRCSKDTLLCGWEGVSVEELGNVLYGSAKLVKRTFLEPT